MIRRVLEKLGFVEPRPPEVEEVLSDAMTVNREARREIHESQNRRQILQLRLERERRMAQRR